VDDGGRGRSDRVGRAATGGAIEQQAGQFLRRQMVVVRVAFAGLLRARVRGKQHVVRAVHRHRVAPAAHAHALPDRPERHRIEGPVEDRVAVTLHAYFFPRSQVVRRRGQRLERGVFRRLEAPERRHLGRAVAALPCRRAAPLQHVGVGLRQRRGYPAAQEVPLDVVDAALFHFPLVFGRPRAARRDEEAIVLGALAVARLDQRVVPPRCLRDAGLEVVDHQPPRHAPEEVQRVPMQPQPGRDGLIEHKFGVLIATPRQRHDEDPGAPECAGLRVGHAPGEPEVDLRLLARLPLHAHRRVGLGRREAMHEAVDRGHTAGIAALTQALPDRRALHALRVQACHQVPVWLKGRDHLRGR